MSTVRVYKLVIIPARGRSPSKISRVVSFVTSTRSQQSRGMEKQVMHFLPLHFASLKSTGCPAAFIALVANVALVHAHRFTLPFLPSNCLVTEYDSRYILSQGTLSFTATFKRRPQGCTRTRMAPSDDPRRHQRTSGRRTVLSRPS